MEETLGKRIVFHRKKLGLTQDQLAERLGVTAQAVSKWENDQSCPDIAMLPRLAEIFGITTDALLGIKKSTVHHGEVVTSPIAEDTDKESGHSFALNWDSGRRGAMGFALWVLLVGGLLLASGILSWNVGFWEILWPSGLLLFGLFGLYPKFSFLRLGCALFGCYFLLNHLDIAPFTLGKELLLPVFLLLFGLSLLMDALRKPKKGRFHVTHNGKDVGKSKSHFSTDGESFDCNTTFGENHRFIQLPKLSGGSAHVSFGELVVDLSGCDEIADGCSLDVNCDFGELEILIPRHCRAAHDIHTAFASVEVQGYPNPDAAAVIRLSGSTNFGQTTIRYI